MVTIDIRAGDTAKIDSIQFADDSASASFVTLNSYRPSEVCLYDLDECGVSNIFISDIPNLIKALEKAYELWGEKK